MNQKTTNQNHLVFHFGKNNFWISGILFLFASCITVNVNFPESAVKKAADDFVKELYSSEAQASAPKDLQEANPTQYDVERQAQEVKKSIKKKSKKRKVSESPEHARDVDATKANDEPTPKQESPEPQSFNVWPDLIATAFAQEINTSSPQATKIKTRMAARVRDLSKWKSKGSLGESYDGTLVLKDIGSLSAEERKQANKLKEDENKDREALYEEIQDVNKIKDPKQTRLRKMFGEAFRQHSPAGTWIEAEDGKWMKK